ncbi:MAG TPA: ATP-binding protein [Gemmatimonadaceae bacterium]|jgi:PAS domain S-box-containing protein|nr:ATP-binding protein [Gemmatimonadaceae bacterium]
MTMPRANVAQPLSPPPTTVASTHATIVWLVVTVVVAALGYPLARWVGLGPPSGPWAYWPLLGALCGILFRRPYREWIAIGLAATVAQSASIYLLRGDLAGGATIVGALTGVVQAAIGAWIVRRLKSRESPLERPQDLAWFVLFAVTLVPLTITPFSAFTYSRGLGLPYSAAWWPLFVGSSLSILLFAPPFMCWQHRAEHGEPWRASGGEITACELTVVALSIVSFAAPNSWLRFVALPYSMFLVLAWAAMRCGTRWTSIAIVIVASISSWCTARGLGPFGSASARFADNVLALQAYLAFAAFSSLALAALTEQRRRAYATLALQNAVRDAFLESSMEALMVKDMSGRYVIVNRAAAEIYGQPRDDLLGRDFRQLGDARSAELITSHDRRVIARGEAITFDETLSDGRRTLRFRVTRFPVRDHTGEIRYIGIIARDETAERELAERLHRAQSVEMLGQLAAGVAHDLNNLLTVLVANTQLLADLPDRSQEERELLRDSSQSASQAAKLTSRLMAIGRRQTAPATDVSVDDAVRELEPLLRALVRGNVDLVLELHAAGARAIIDATSIEQIVLNLVSNARAAIAEDGRITVSTRVVIEAPATDAVPQVARRRLRLTVTDTGSGMSEQTLAQIFEPFFTTKAESGGTGLGLFTVSMLVRQAGGAISATSTLGEATSFLVDLPLDS